MTKTTVATMLIENTPASLRNAIVGTLPRENNRWHIIFNRDITVEEAAQMAQPDWDHIAANTADFYSNDELLFWC